MGNVRLGPPRELMLELKTEFSVQTFVETGTFYGDTAAWASNQFSSVTTIELDKDLYESASREYANMENISFEHGFSQSVLPGVIEDLNSNAIFWLDAHYSGGKTAGEDYECPLIDELTAIGDSDRDHFIFIDDARLFYSPPPHPHDPADWPTIADVISTIRQEFGREYYIVITEDVIVAVPPVAENIVKKYAQDVATEQARESQFHRGLRLVYSGSLDLIITEKNVNRLRRWGIFPLAKKSTISHTEINARTCFHVCVTTDVQL